jgi:hypothetical protein
MNVDITSSSTPRPRRLRRRFARRLAVAGLAASGTFAALAVSTAGAGGWAVTTLDAIPAPPASGQVVDVGFTIRQHGVTPVALDEGVAIEITSTKGEVTVFPAVASGGVGHYTAPVTFPTAGTYDWAVQQGWFGEQDLGDLTISAPAAVAGEYRFPAVLRYGLPALAVALAAFAIADAAAGIRRRRAIAL